MPKYISVKTFEIDNDIFEVDDAIAETISILNKKGYHTTYSCSGHSEPQFQSIAYIPVKTIESFIEMNKDSKYYILGQQKVGNQDVYVIVTGFDYTEVYISFDKEYEFSSLPHNFEYSTLGNHSSLSQMFDLFDENGNLLSEDEISDKLKQANEDLLNWAKSLEQLKNKVKKRTK